MYFRGMEAPGWGRLLLLEHRSGEYFVAKTY